MKTWPVPADEAFRQQALLGYDLYGSAPEREYDAITKHVADVLAIPMCMITIVGKEAQWVKSAHGLDIQATGREMAFCAHTIIGDDPLIVTDAMRDARFRTNPLVTGKPYIRFYAGAPIITSDGAHVGALCVLDQQPRASTDIQILTRMASLTAELFNKRRYSGTNKKPDESRPNSDLHPRISIVRGANRMLADRRRLAAHFSRPLLADPALSIILEIFVANEEGRTCTVSSLSRAGSIPFSSCHRWVSRLVELGLARLEVDSTDHRKALVKITHAGQYDVEKLFSD